MDKAKNVVKIELTAYKIFSVFFALFWLYCVLYILLFRDVKFSEMLFEIAIFVLFSVIFIYYSFSYGILYTEDIVVVKVLWTVKSVELAKISSITGGQLGQYWILTLQNNSLYLTAPCQKKKIRHLCELIKAANPQAEVNI